MRTPLNRRLYDALIWIRLVAVAAWIAEFVSTWLRGPMPLWIYVVTLAVSGASIIGRGYLDRKDSV